jgi:hypothetical protein
MMTEATDTSDRVLDDGTRVDFDLYQLVVGLLVAGHRIIVDDALGEVRVTPPITPMQLQQLDLEWEVVGKVLQTIEVGIVRGITEGFRRAGLGDA